MKIKLEKKHHLYILIFIMVIGILIRVHQIDKYPEFSESADELAYAWQGYSLLHTGIPTSWSWLDAYNASAHKIEYINIRTHEYRLVTPWLDHPSIYSILQGPFIYFKKDMKQISNLDMRIISILIYILTTIFLYIVVKKEFTEKHALISSAIYSFASAIILLNRLSVTENLLTFFMIIILYFIQKYEQQQKIKDLYLASLFCGLSLMTKEIGIVTFLFLGIYLITRKDKFFLKLIGIFLAFLIAYTFYGYLFDLDLFIKTKLEMQLLYTFDFQSVLNRFYSSKILFNDYFDAIVLLGWISFFSRKFDKFSLLFISYFIGIIITSGGFIFGWYTIPLYLFYSIFISEFLIKTLKTNDTSHFAIYILPISYFIYLDEIINSKSAISWILRTIFIIAILIYIFKEKIKIPIKKITIYGSLSIYILINILLILMINTTYTKIFQ